jgi:hypothetical protein
MDIRATLKPGVNGTMGLLREYGEQLVCVRYRYDKVRRKRYKTVELIVEEKDWILSTLVRPEQRVYFRIGYGESELREQVKQAGGYWNPEKKAWHLSYKRVLELGLETRIIDELLTF